jgi:hypothetical protein
MENATMQSIAFYATLDNTTLGVALRDAAGRVHFRDDSTDLWTELTNADAPRLTLYGRCDLADTQALADGDKVYRCSKTLQTRRAA